MIAAHVGQYPIGLMCLVAGVSYAGFWCWRKNPVGKISLVSAGWSDGWRRLIDIAI